VSLMELGGNLDKGQRVETVRSGAKRELLPRSWQEHYVRLLMNLLCESSDIQSM
jgi:hypothetical protein